MKERIIEFLRAENKSSSQFAEEIGVQPSGISHIISGRNKPSLDFILKMLEKYKYLSSEWLLFGKGAMYNDQPQQELFIGSSEEKPQQKSFENELFTEKQNKKMMILNEEKEAPEKDTRTVERIAWFYNDGTFDEYFPSKK